MPVWYELVATPSGVVRHDSLEEPIPYLDIAGQHEVTGDGEAVVLLHGAFAPQARGPSSTRVH